MRQMIESVEARRLLAAYTINGTSSADEINLRVTDSSIIWDVNGIGSTVPAFLYDSVIINAQGQSDDIFIEELRLPLTINGGASNDFVQFNQSSRDMDNIAANVTVNGGTGTDFVTFNDDFSGSASVYSISGTGQFSRGSFWTISSAADVEQLELFASNQQNDLSITQSATSPTIFADLGQGIDVTDVTLTSQTIPRGVNLNNSEDVRIVDLAPGFGAQFDISGSSVIRDGFTFVVNGLPGPTFIAAGDADDTLITTSTGANLLIFHGENGNDMVNVGVASTGQPNFVQLFVGQYGSITLGQDASVTLGAFLNEVSKTLALNIDPAASFNLLSGALLVETPGVADPTWAAIQNLLTISAGGTFGFNDGPGIYSTMLPANGGIGMVPANTYGGPLGGYTTNINTFVLRGTLLGDINLDRDVDFPDLLALAQNYGTNTSKHWFRGDWDYDADTDFQNLLSLAQNYGQSFVNAPAPVFSRKAIRLESDEV
jgi:hypothetical protein